MTDFTAFFQKSILGAAMVGLAACGGNSSTAETESSAAEPVQEMIETAGETATAEVAPEIDLDAAEAAALDFFDYLKGEWDAEWTMYDSQGNVTAVIEGTQSFSPLADEYSQLMTNTLPAVNHTSYAVRGYSKKEGVIVSLNIGPGGDYWSMRQNPITGETISEPHLNDDGTTTIRRFYRSGLSEQGYRVLMEISLDGGETWFKRFEQKMERKTD